MTFNQDPVHIHQEQEAEEGRREEQTRRLERFLPHFLPDIHVRVEHYKYVDGREVVSAESIFLDFENKQEQNDETNRTGTG